MVHLLLTAANKFHANIFFTFSPFLFHYLSLNRKNFSISRLSGLRWSWKEVFCWSLGEKVGEIHRGIDKENHFCLRFTLNLSEVYFDFNQKL
jgi:hypothetical protein